MSRVVTLSRASTDGELNGRWKGEGAGYKAFHIWAANNFDKPTRCEICLEPANGRRLDWAMRTSLLSRNRADWLYLCRTCHRKYDRERSETI